MNKLIWVAVNGLERAKLLATKYGGTQIEGLFPMIRNGRPQHGYVFSFPEAAIRAVRLALIDYAVKNTTLEI